MDTQDNLKFVSAFSPLLFSVNIIVSILGAIIGLEIITRLGVTPNTSIIGALFAVLISYFPLKLLKNLRNRQSQSLIQTASSGATFSAANGMLVPIGILFLMGENELIIPMLIGATLAVITDACMIYFCFDSEAFPAKNPWPPGIATSQTIMAIEKGKKQSLILLTGAVGGFLGKSVGIPTDIVGVGWIGNSVALVAFAIGLLIRGYTEPILGINIQELYIPHGIMIGAGFIAFIQIVIILSRNKNNTSGHSKDSTSFENSTQISSVGRRSVRKGLFSGFAIFFGISCIIAIATGIWSNMSLPMFLLWLVFAASAAVISEMVVGLAAMHSGWFPAFATTLIFLILGGIIGFPPVPLALLVGFTAATGPAFADMGYDLKAGWILRGEGKNPAFEIIGRRQQLITEITSFVISFVMVLFLYKYYFNQDLIPPVDRVFVASIEAASDTNIIAKLSLWAVLGAVIQIIGGIQRQIGTLLATGLLINFPIAGISMLVALLIRAIAIFLAKRSDNPQAVEKVRNSMYLLGAGMIVGSTLYSFFTSTLRLGKKS